jgi:hypothetical protein
MSAEGPVRAALHGRIALTDPDSDYAPEFAQMRVLRSPVGALAETDAAERAITFDA